MAFSKATYFYFSYIQSYSIKYYEKVLKTGNSKYLQQWFQKNKKKSFTFLRNLIFTLLKLVYFTFLSFN